MENFLTKKVKFDEHSALMTTINRLFGLRTIEYPEGKRRPLITMCYLLIIWASCTATLALDDSFEGHRKQLRLEKIFFMFLYYLSILSVILLGIMGCYYSEMFTAYRKKITQIDHSLDKLGQYPTYSDIIVKTTIIIVFSFSHMFLSYAIYLKELFKKTNTAIALYTAITRFYGSNIASIVLFEFTLFGRIGFRVHPRSSIIAASFIRGSRMNLAAMLAKHRTSSLSKGRSKPETNSSINYYDRESLRNWIDLRYQKANNVLKSFARDGFEIRTKKLNTIDRIVEITENLRSKFPKRLNNWMQSQHVYTEHGTLMLDNRIEAKEVMDCNRRRYLLQATRLLHLELCDATKLLCTIFNVQITLLTLIGMLYTTAIIYYIYLEMKNSNNSLFGSMTFITMPIIDCVAYGIKFGLLGRICMSAEKEASTTLELIHACSESEANCETKKEIRQFALQIAHVKAGLSACGFFRINFTFIRERLSSVITCVLIMIQMSQSLELEGRSSSPQKLANTTQT